MFVPPPLTPPGLPPREGADAPVPEYRDRKVGLVLWGVVLIALGAMCVFAIPAMLVSQALVSRLPQRLPHQVPLDGPVLVSTLTVYALCALGFIWLGIGSIRTRRWARALILCFAWLMLLGGLVALAVLPWTLGGLEQAMRQQGTPISAAMLTIMKIMTVALVAFLYVMLPGAIVLFYRSPNVRRTCEVRDPVERWTDRCPLPVLLLCVVQAMGAGCILMLPGFGSAFPLAGIMVTGWAARLTWVAFGALCFYAMRGCYRLERRAWWVYTTAVALCWINFAYSIRALPLRDYYLGFGYSEAFVDQMMSNPMMQSNAVAWLTTAGVVPMFGYLVFVRRYFPAQVPQPR